MRADIGGDRTGGGGDLRRVDGPRLLVEDMRGGDAVDVAALERHLDGDHALRPHLDPCGGDVDLMRAGRGDGANDGKSQNGTGDAASYAPNVLGMIGGNARPKRPSSGRAPEGAVITARISPARAKRSRRLKCTDPAHP